MIRPRWTIPLIVACGAAGALGAQEPPARDGLRHGGFGAPVVKLTEIDGNFGVFVGGRGGWIIDGTVMIGGGGYSLANRGDFEDVTDDSGSPGSLEMAYGGLELGYVVRPEGRVHLAVGLLIGGGGLTWSADETSNTDADDAFFVAEPEVDVVVHLASFMRAAVGVGYRLARGVELFDIGNAEVSGPAAVLSLQFGSF